MSQQYPPQKMIYRIVEQRMASTLGEETIVLDYMNGEYYELDEVGGFIWQLLQNATELGFDEIVSELTKTFECTADECKEDVVKFLNELVRAKLIEEI